MFQQTATDLTKVSNDLVLKWLDSFDTVLTDCDGKHILMQYKYFVCLENECFEKPERYLHLANNDH